MNKKMQFTPQEKAELEEALRNISSNDLALFVWGCDVVHKIAGEKALNNVLKKVLGGAKRWLNE